MPLNAPALCISQRRRTWLLCDPGQSLIELALTLPLFALLVLGTSEIAYYGWGAILTSNAARAGAAYGSQNSVFAADTNGISNAAANDSSGLTGMTTNASLACYCSTASAIAIPCNLDLTLCPSPATVLKFLTVTTSAHVPSLFTYPGLPTNFTASGNATMEVVGP